MGGWHHSRTECAQQAGRWPRSQEGSYQVEGAPGPWPAAAEGTGEISNPTPRSDDPQPANPAHRPPARQAHIPARAPSKALKPRFQLRGIYPFRRTILSVNGIWSRKMTTYTTHESRTTNPIRCAPHRPFFLAALFFQNPRTISTAVALSRITNNLESISPFTAIQNPYRFCADARSSCAGGGSVIPDSCVALSRGARLPLPPCLP